MRSLPAGLATDLAILELTGSSIEDRGDHFAIRTPSNPNFHWGNCLIVLTENADPDAQRWLATFNETFPSAGWVSIGLTAVSANPAAWVALGLTVEHEDVLTSQSQPRQAAHPDGYSVRQLSGADWDQLFTRGLTENEGEDPVTHAEFVRAMVQSRRQLSERGVAAFFGAFADEVLVADLGIVCCGTTARYQAVGTDPAHRRRGLAAHLLGVAAQWSADQGCHQWVIVTEATNPAGRVYRAAGFELDTSTSQIYRRPGS